MPIEATIVQQAEPPRMECDPWSVETLLDPYPMFAAIRDAGPVVWLERYGMYAVARHEECRTVLSDYARFMTGAGTTMYDIRKPGRFRTPSRLLEADPPEHTSRRKVLARLISPVALREMRATFDRSAAAFVKDLLARGTFDGVTDLAEPFIISVFPSAVGVRLDRTKALAIAEMRFNESCPHNELFHRSLAAAQPYLEWFDAACREDNVEPGSIAAGLFAAERAGELEDGVASSIVRSFVGGGVDSTISAIGHTLHHLARNPDQFALVKAEPARIRGAFEEAIRLDTPFQYTWRTTRHATSLSGYDLPDDAKIAVLLGSANRDPRRWDDATRYDITRKTIGNYLGFGVADHNCVGQAIARLEAEAILSAIIAGSDTLTLAAPAAIRPINQMRVLGSLPLRVISSA